LFVHPIQFPRFRGGANNVGDGTFWVATKVDGAKRIKNFVSLIMSPLPAMTLPHDAIERCLNALDRNRSLYKSALQRDSVRVLHDLLLI
jgi:hypothetical protein